MKVKEFCKKYKKAIINMIVLLIALIIISAVCFIALYFTGVIKVSSSGGLAFNMDLFTKIKGKWWSYLLYFIFQVISTVILCFVPGTSMAFIMVGVALWGSNIYTFLLVFAGVLASSLLMDLIGRFGGVAVIKKLFGEDEYNSGKALLREKGVVYLPIMYLFPIFPDDLLCCLAGLTRIKLWYHTLIILLCRGVGIFTIVFGLNLIPFDNFVTLTDWIIFILAAIIAFYVIFRVARMIDVKLTKSLKDKNKNLNKLLVENSEEFEKEEIVVKEEKPKKPICEELVSLDKQFIWMLIFTFIFLVLLIYKV